jgi:flagellar biogenesis protein FliO
MNAAETDASLKGARMSAPTEAPRMFASSSLLARLANSFIALLASIKFQRRERMMRLCETLPLGEKRFLAIVQIEQQRFLIAVTNQSVSLLRCLDSAQHQQNGRQEFSRESEEH